jgi:hypothetical protein
MPAKASHFPGIAPIPPQAPDRGADALCGGRLSVHKSNRGLRPAHRAIRYRRAFFARGELDGAEGIDGAEACRN